MTAGGILSIPSPASTQQDIARKLNINQTAISQWERGSTVPKNEKLIQLCEILETSSDYLLGISDDPAFRDAESKAVVNTIGSVMESIEAACVNANAECQDMTLEILNELLHLLHIRNLRQKTASLHYLSSTLSSSTQFIDTCIASSLAKDLETGRILKNKDLTLSHLELSLNSLSEILIKSED